MMAVYRDAAPVFQSVRRDSRVYGHEGPGHEEIEVWRSICLFIHLALNKSVHGQVAAATCGPIRIITNYRLSRKQRISAGEMYLKMYVEWAGGHFWSWVDANRSTFDEDMRVYIFVPSDLNLWPLDLKFAPLVTLVQRYVFTKLEVSTAFLFRENRIHGTDGRTVGVQHLMWPSWEGRIITYIGKSNSISITNIILT